MKTSGYPEMIIEQEQKPEDTPDESRTFGVIAGCFVISLLILLITTWII